MIVLLFGFCVISGVFDILTRARRASVTVRRECFARRSLAFQGRRFEFIHEKSIATVSAACGRSETYSEQHEDLRRRAYVRASIYGA
jgi:hypothetical protein